MQHLLIHWFVISPTASWLTSDRRGWNKRTGIWLAMAFLIAAALIGIQRTESNHYELLGVSRNASEKEIATVYRRRAVQLHPDRNPSPDAAAEFIKLKEAAEVISNKSKRETYAKFGDFEDDMVNSGNMSMLAIVPVLTYVVNWIVGVMSTLTPELSSARMYISLYIVFACVAELLMRFFDQDLFCFVPFIGNWLQFEKIAALRSLFSSILSYSIIISRETYHDMEATRIALCREVVSSNMHLHRYFQHATRIAGSMKENGSQPPTKPTGPIKVPQSAAMSIASQMHRARNNAGKAPSDKPQPEGVRRRANAPQAADTSAQPAGNPAKAAESGSSPAPSEEPTTAPPSETESEQPSVRPSERVTVAAPVAGPSVGDLLNMGFRWIMQIYFGKLMLDAFGMWEPMMEVLASF